MLTRPSDLIRQEWCTPDYLWAILDAEYEFTLDGAATKANRLCHKFNSREVPNAHAWAKNRTFCNPPWNNIPMVLPHIFHTGDVVSSALVVLLVPDRTDQAWFHSLLPFMEVHFFRGRIQYTPPPGVKATSIPFGSMLLVGGRDISPGTIRRRDAKTGDYI